MAYGNSELILQQSKKVQHCTTEYGVLLIEPVTIGILHISRVD
jgi:hypothetical protein